MEILNSIVTTVGIVMFPYFISYMIARGWRNGKSELRNIKKKKKIC